MDSAILVFLVAVLVPTALALSKGRKSVDLHEFRPAPALRAVYPGVSVACILAEYFYIKELWEAKHPPAAIDWVALAGVFGVLLTGVLSWPPSVYVSSDGLRWRRLFSRQFIPWRQIESAHSGIDGNLVIFVTGGRRYEVSEYTEGVIELKAVIKTKLTELHGADVRVR